MDLIRTEKRFDTRYVNRDDKERMYQDHVKRITDYRTKQFTLLVQDTTFPINETWSSAKKKLRDDKRYTDMNSESEKEKIFDRKMRLYKRNAEDEFYQLLRETTSLRGCPSMDSSKYEVPLTLMQADYRYTTWNSAEEERTKMIQDYLAAEAKKEEEKDKAKG
eukprot:TRINITY_DN6222_c0_g1_i1.p1 TRINITY_DN6222_c0_g1~~TRINITY_DN6222_c0_g1_i1.p1  ORF type:complete len:163 (-),score=39.32 TRINITY_DN6222_c0_g1_i1:22-510(-)